jgi:hypothetical protein
VHPLTANTQVLASTTKCKVLFQIIGIDRKRYFASKAVDNQPQSLQGEAQLKALKSQKTCYEVGDQLTMHI